MRTAPLCIDGHTKGTHATMGDTEGAPLYFVMNLGFNHVGKTHIIPGRLGRTVDKEKSWRKWIPIGVSIFIVTIIMISIVRFGEFAFPFFDEDRTDGDDGPTSYNDGEWFTVENVTSNSFDIIVHDTPQGVTSLSCMPTEHIYNRLNPQMFMTRGLYKPLPTEIDLETFDPDNYDEGSLPHNARGRTIITGYQDVTFSEEYVLHDSVASCALIDHDAEPVVVESESVVVQRTLIEIPKVDGEHQPIVNVTMTKDWDGLTLHFEGAESMTWWRSSEIYLGESDYSTSETTVDEFSQHHESVSNSRYIGGIKEGQWIIGIWGGAGDGYVEHVTWYLFEYTGKDCESPDRCETPVEMTAYATLPWPL